MSRSSHVPRHSRKAPRLSLVAVALLLAAGTARGASPTGPFGLFFGLGGGRAGAAAVVGAGFAPYERGGTRVELVGRLQFEGGETESLDASSGVAGSATVSWVSFIGEVALARHVGPLEPWVGAGVWTASPSGDFEYTCLSSEAPACASAPSWMQYEAYEGSSVTGATVSGGGRLAITDTLLLEAELRWRQEGRSVFRELGVVEELGGFSGTLGVIWRPGSRPAEPPLARGPAATGPPTGAKVAPGAEPPEPPPERGPPAACVPRCDGRRCGDDGCGGTCGSCPEGRACDAAGRCDRCASGSAPVFSVHPARRFRCYPDPVAREPRCERAGLLGEFTDRASCVRTCHLGLDACPEGGPVGAACGRCAAACGEVRAVPCSAEGRARLEAGGCRVDAGVWGSAEAVVVPVSCPGGAVPLDGR